MTLTAPTVDTHVPLSPKQLRSVAMAPLRKHAIWVGAVGAGKTVASLLAFLIAIVAVPQGQTIVIIGNTIQSIERNVIGVLQDPALFGPLSKLTLHTRGSSVAIILGRHVELIGAPNASAENRIRGSSIALVYVDEITLLQQPFWNLLLTRLRVHDGSGKNISRLLGTTNPKSANHWLRQQFILQPDATDTITFHLTMDDNPSVTDEDKRLLAASFSGLFYDRDILGKWTNAEGAVYEQWDHDRHTIMWDDLPTFRDIFAVGVDHGTTNPSSAIMLALTDEHDDRGRPAPRLVLLDEWRWDPAETGSKLTNVEQSARLRTWLRRHHTPGVELLTPRFVYVDPAAGDFREQLRRDRLTNWTADNAVGEGIADVSSLLTQGLAEGRPRLVVAKPKGIDVPGCGGFLSEVTEYRWDPKATENGDDAPIKEADHSMDAARYAVRSSRSLWLPAMRQAYGLAA